MAALPDSQVTSLNTAAADFKEMYDPERVYHLIWDNNPELTLIGKKDDVVGNYLAHDVNFGGSQGVVIGPYASALKNQTPEQYATFHVPMATLYGLGTLKNQAIAQSRTKQGAFEDLVEGAMKNAIMNCANELSRAMMSGTGSASIGQIQAIQQNPANYPANTAQVTLTDPLAYQFFEQGMTLDVTATDGSAPQGAPDTVTVLAVDAGAGILVLSAPTSGSWAAGFWIVGAWLIRDGNYSANVFGQAISTQQGIAAFQPMQFASMGSWIPSAAFRKAPGLAAAPFLNVPRQLNGTRLAGQGLDKSNVPIIQGLTEAAIAVGIYNSNKDLPEYVSLNPTSYASLLGILQGQKLYTPVELDAVINYSFLTLEGAGKPLKIINSRNVPPKTAYFWSPGDFSLASSGPCPAPMPYGDMEFLPLPDDDANQFRAGGYVNLVCNNPRGCAQVKLQQ